MTRRTELKPERARMGYVADLERHVADRIVRDLAEHTVCLLKADGLHRHWRCQKPDTRCMSFDIVTWPGHLCYCGDMGDYVFRRTEDMVAFMRGSAMSFGYAAEKCIAHDGRLKEWRVEIWEECLTEEQARLAEDYPEKAEEHAEKFEEIRRNYYGMFETEHDAMRAMYESGLWDGCDLPNCKSYTFHFLWCLHAIKWFCDRV